MSVFEELLGEGEEERVDAVMGFIQAELLEKLSKKAAKQCQTAEELFLLMYGCAGIVLGECLRSWYQNGVKLGGEAKTMASGSLATMLSSIIADNSSSDQ